MTKTQHKNLKIGDIIIKQDDELGLGMWVITTKHRRRGSSYENEFFVHTELYSPEYYRKGWSEFTFSNTRADLSSYNVLTPDTHPEYFL